ncbi:MAG: hypothetical protein IPI73_24350 [Betaproteobacteria bacterium]|nr:hypothetical protein [Betaproteobacteria bacterium]
MPEGDSISYEYDDAPCSAQLRCTHNVKTFRRIAKPGSGQTTLVSSFTYESAFNNVATETDPLGNTTDFTYTGQGELLAILPPPDAVGGAW